MAGDLRDRLQQALGSSYRIVAELGGGGMSRVFEAEETALGRRVVIKVLPPELAAGVSIERFKRETQLAAQLQHPHIVPVLSAGAAGDLLYYTMPRIDGESVRARITREGPMPIDAVIRLFREVTDALQYAHGRGIVHRDIKPDNVLLSGSHAFVTDFGVAKALDAATGSGFNTSVGVALGTPAYMAPEQVSADPKADHRVDIYSLGALVYEALTGRPPFVASSPQALLAAHVLTPPDPVTSHRPDTPPALASAVMRALEKEPANRWQTADDLRDHIPAIEARRAKLAPNASGSRRLNFTALGIIAAALAVIGVGAWLAGRRGSASPSAATPASGVGAGAGEYVASVAVLPFDNIGGAASEAYFTEGITEEIIAQLAQVRGLKVISRTSVSALKRSSLTLPQIAESLHVRHVLEGSVRRSGDSIRVTAQLIDASSDSHLWSARYDRSLRDVFGVQEEIAREVSSKLVPGQAAPRAQGTASRTGTPLAYEAYLRGTYWRQSRTRSGLERAISAFEEAIALDSSYAPAYAGLAAANVHWASYRHAGTLDPYVALARARAFAERAIELDPNQAEGYAALGYAYYHLPSYADSSIAYERRAIALRPNYAEAHAWMVVPLGHRGHVREGLAHADTATTLDPLAPGLHTAYARGALRAGQYDLAARQARASYTLEPTLSTPRMLEAVALLLEARYADCWTLDLGSFAPIRAACLARGGETAAASRLIDSVITAFRDDVEHSSVAGALAAHYAVMGNADSAALWVGRSARSPVGFDPSLFPTAIFERVAANERFAKAVALHLAQVAARIDTLAARERTKLRRPASPKDR